MGNNQDHIDILKSIKTTVVSLAERMKSTNAGEIQTTVEEYVGIVERFYNKYGELMAVEQYRQAKADIEYFMRLVELAIGYEKTGGDGE